MTVSLEDGWRAFRVAAGAVQSPRELDGEGVAVRLPEHLGNVFAGELDGDDLWLLRRIERPTRTRLCLARLGPIAEVFVDGEPRLHARNLFRGYELELPAGAHELAIALPSPARVLAERRPRPRWKTRLVAHQQLRWLRAPLLGRMPSWSGADAPRGVFTAPRLVDEGVLVAEDVFLHARIEDGRGIVHARLPTWARARTLRVGEHEAPFTRGTDGVPTATLAIDDPPRWWPHTHGAPTRLPARLLLDGELALGAIGFRTLATELDRRGFGLRVNDVPIFCRGAVYVPQPRRLDLDLTRRALTALRDAGGNMVRIGGTMRYEDAPFFALCDELGLLVWQDFMFANMDYPVDDPAFLAEIDAEVDEQLRALARHPSLAVLCGGSEVAQQAAMVGQPAERWYGPLFEERLPARCAAVLPEVPYVLNSPSSPLDGDGAGEPPPLPFRPDRGVSHYYGVGAYLRPFDDARRAEVSFASECLGLSNVPEPEAVDALFGDELPVTHTPRWKAGVPRDHGAGWDFEDVRDHYLELLFGEGARGLRYADPEAYLERSRLVSVEMMGRVFAEWRRAGSPTRGGLVWLLRDLQPGAGWGLLDSEGREKAALYALRRAWAPTALFVTDEGTSGLRLHVVHEGATPLRLRLEVALFRGSETRVAEATREIVVERGAIAIDAEGLFGGFRDVGWAYRFGPRAHDLLLAWLRDGDALVAEAAHFLAPPAPSDPGLSVELVRRDEGSAVLTVRATRLALYVVARVPGWRADAGYFHLEPGGSRQITLHARGPGASPPKGEVCALGAAPVRVA